MNMESLGKMKTCTVTNWIDDHFNELERRVPDLTRFLLEDVLETIYIEDELERVQFHQRIYDPELTPEGVSDLFREMNERLAPVRDQYAPRQRDLTE